MRRLGVRVVRALEDVREWGTMGVSEDVVSVAGGFGAEMHGWRGLTGMVEQGGTFLS